MQLYTEHPYGLLRHGIVSAYRSLDEEITVDIAIIGAGISGALAAYYLRNTGHSIAVLERRHVAMGSTAASTAFLQYELDVPLAQLTEYVGRKNAVQAYTVCREAIYTLQKICGRLKPRFDFHLRPSLQYASFKNDKDQLYREYTLRKQYGFNVRWMDHRQLEEKFGLSSAGAILSADAGDVDAYMLTNVLLAAVHKKGHSVYTNTNVRDIVYGKRSVTLDTGGHKVKAKKVIIACGYESLKYIPKKIAGVHTTYALVSEPLAPEKSWHRDCLIWETARPYLYFRKTANNRVLVGGKDDRFHHPKIPHSVIARKADMLVRAYNRRMPHMPVTADYSWAGAFVVTKDGLPYIGAIPQRPNTFFALGYGGNGITFSVIAAEMIRDMIAGKKNSACRIFSFDR